MYSSTQQEPSQRKPGRLTSFMSLNICMMNTNKPLDDELDQCLARDRAIIAEIILTHCREARRLAPEWAIRATHGSRMMASESVEEGGEAHQAAMVGNRPPRPV